MLKLNLQRDLVAALEYSREHSLQDNAIHLSGVANIIWNEFLKDIGISRADSLIIVRMDQFQLCFSPWYTGSLVLLMIQNPKVNWLKICIFPHYRFRSLFILRRKRRNSGTSHHPSAHETPFSIYVAFLLHFQSFVCGQVDDLGLSIYYDQMLVLSTQLPYSVYTQFEFDGVFCATKLFSNVFTMIVADNIDRNPSSPSAKDFCLEPKFLRHSTSNQRQMW